MLAILQGVARLVLLIGRTLGVIVARIVRVLIRLPVHLFRFAANVIGLLVVAGVILLAAVVLVKLVSLG